ncbi:PAS domain-containing protein [Hymenobacter arizonensis]|uniref:histidine kinase n=1 Tax=Hymenobacter arizonensis TaxID=1227077 RepID=A0A1I6AJ85_HYMAR|nr:PAS domain-containing protein [Hymenobacter arizonensis]SFQ68713.1 PAS domain S-box-containing protein [Hymenobacter arizonensis]
MSLAPPPPDLLPVFNALPGANLLLSPDWVIVGASDDYLAATLTQREVIVGQHIFDAFPDNPSTPEANAVANVRASLAQVLATRQPHEMAPQHYDVPDRAQPGRFVERHWLPRHTPVLDAAGQVQFIIQSVQDITAGRLSERLLRESQASEQAARADAEQQRHEVRHFLEQAPVAVAMYRGAQFQVELANATMLAIWDRPLEAVLNRPIVEVLPETATPEVVAIFERVFTTGASHTAYEQPTVIHRHGRQEVVYWNTVFEPQHGPDGRVSGIFTVGTEVTEQVRARQQVQQLNLELEARVQQRTREAEASRTDAEEQRNRLLRLFNQAPALINIFTGPDHVWTLVHPGTHELLQNRPLVGLSHRQALPELPEENHEPFDRVYRTGEPVHVLEALRRLDRFRDGKLHDEYFDLSLHPMFDAAGQMEGVMSFAVNVTERVRARQQAETLQAEVLAAAQRQAQQREAFFQILADTPAAVALLRGPEHRFEYVNVAYQQLFPERQLTGRPLAEALPETEEAGFLRLLDRVYRTGETFFGTELPMRLVPAGGGLVQQVYYTFTYQAYRENDQIAGVSIFAFDVTEQVQAREQREAERQQLRDLFEQAPVAIGILRGADYVVEVANPFMGRLWGRAPAEVLGRPVFEALPEVRDQGFQELLDGVRQSGEAFVAEGVPAQLLRGGTVQTVYLTYVYQPLRDADGTVTRVAAVGTDVTAQVQARQRVQELNDQLAAINEQLAASNAELGTSNTQLMRTNVDLDNFIYTASHDLKAPISNIEGLLYLLREELPAEVTQDAHIGPTLSRMLESVERFKRTINHLTEVSKLQKENAPTATLVDLAAVVEDVRQDLRPLLQAAGAKLVVDVSAQPPVHFSQKNLRSIVYNLLSNAIKYHSPDRPPRIDVRAHIRDGHTVLEVHDNGLGLDGNHLPRLFNMFQRFHDHVEGTGIGLYMVKRMVENAGGRIEVHSQLGAGTTFFVFLPHAGSLVREPFPAFISA